MKKVFLMITIPVCLLMGQDQPQLPGWGVYVGGGSFSASIDDFDSDSVKSNTLFPSVGISKGVMAGGFPLLVGVGYHQRGYAADLFGAEMKVSYNTLDVWAMMPYPMGPATLNAGVMVGTFLDGKVEWLGIEEDFEDEDLPDGLDYGVMLGVGYPVGPLNLNVGYALGLADHDGGSFNGLFFNAGYAF